MMKMFAAAMVASVALCSAAMAQTANDLSGVWRGVYWGGGNQATEMQMTLRDSPGPDFHGSAVEVNNFGDQSAPFLLSTLRGEVSGNQVTIVKTYDGTAGVSHSVMYSGRLVSPRRIVGEWSVSGTSGRFEMAR